MIPEQKAILERAKQETSTVRELMNEVARLKAELLDANIRAGKAITMGLGLSLPALHQDNHVATLTARNERLMEALKEAKSELRDMWHDHPVMVKIDAALEAAIRKGNNHD